MINTIHSYFTWWFGCVKWVTGPITYFLWGVGTPLFNLPQCHGTPNGILLLDVLLIILWILFCMILGLISWQLLGGWKDSDIKERHRTWQYWVGFLTGVVFGPAIFMILIGIGSMITGACKSDNKDNKI